MEGKIYSPVGNLVEWAKNSVNFTKLWDNCSFEASGKD